MSDLSISVYPGETRVLFAQKGEPTELFHDRLSCWPGLGTIVEGRVEEIKTNLGGAFVDLGRGASGFLPRKAWPGPDMKPGDIFPVRVTRTAHDDKPARLSARLNLPGSMTQEQWQALSPSASVIFAAGLAPHTNIIEVDDRHWCDQFNTFCQQAGIATVDAKFLTTKQTTISSIDKAVEAALAPSIPLSCGGAIHIARTPACTTIDVDSNAAGSSPLAINLTAAKTIARALRLRGIGGLVVVDFINMNDKSDRKTLEDGLRLAMKPDREISDILPISRLGLLELSRPRRGPDIRAIYHDQSGDLRPEAASYAAIRQVESAIKHTKSPRLKALVAPQIKDWLTTHPDILKQVESAWLKPVEWHAETGRALHKVDIQDL